MIRFLLIIFLLFFPLVAVAGDVAPAEVVDGNLFSFHPVVEIRGGVKRDAVIVGRRVLISGNVGGDALVLADTIEISGSVDGNLRAVARRIHLTGVVGKNVTVVASSFTLAPGARIGGDLLAKSSRITVAGSIDGELSVTARLVNLNGLVRKRVWVKVPSRGQFLIGPSAEVTGDVAFFSPRETLTIDSRAQIQGRVNHNPNTAPPRSRVITAVALLLGLVVVGAAVMLVAPALLLTPAAVLEKNPARTLLVAITVLIGLVGAFAFTVATVVGALLFLLLFAVLFFGLTISQLVVAQAIGNAVARFTQWRLGAFFALLIGLVLLILMESIPDIGFLVQLLASLLGFGALSISLFRFRTSSLPLHP